MVVTVVAVEVWRGKCGKELTDNDKDADVCVCVQYSY